MCPMPTGPIWSAIPRGSHVADARRLLTRLGAAIAPPSKFARMDYDVPPPLPDELEYIERTVLVFDDPAFAFEPPQPSPDYFLRPQPPEFLALAPPAAPSGAHILAEPVFVPLPVYVDVPAYVVAPPNSSIFNNAHKTPVINSTDNVPTKPDGQAVSSSISTAYANGLADGPRLPSSGATNAKLVNGRTNPVAREAIKVPPSPAVPVVPLMPLWATLDPAAREDIKAPLSPPLAVSSMPFWATENKHTGKLRASNARRLQQIIGGRFRSPRMLAPPPTRNRPKPVTHAASTSSPIAVDQAEQPRRPSGRLAPAQVRAPDVAPGASPVKPQKKPCPVVNGKRTCS